MLGLRLVEAAVAHALREPGTGMLAGIPFIHGGQHVIGLMYREHRTFRQYIQLAVGNDGGDLDNTVGLGIETGHFQVDPDQVVRVLRHRRASLSS